MIENKYINEYNEKGYTCIPQIFEEESIRLATNYYNIKFSIIQDYVVSCKRNTASKKGDIVGPLNEQYYADPLAESFLVQLLPVYRALTGKNLEPTYSFCRYYTKGHWLGEHSDRPSCQYSCTIPIASNLENPWIMYADDDPISARLNDGIFYKGCEVKHRRDVLLEDGYQVQLHLHYIDADDHAYKEYIFDKRPGIGYSVDYKKL